MPTWALVLIIVCSVILLECVVFSIIHRHLLKSVFKYGKRLKAPKWHFWIRKKYRRE